MIIINIILLTILSIVLIVSYKYKVTQITEKYLNNYNNDLQQKKNDLLKEYKKYEEMILTQRDSLDRSLTDRKHSTEQVIEQLENRRREAEKNYNEIIANEKEKINNELEFYRKNKLDGIESGILVEMSEKTAAATKAYEEFATSLDEQKRLREAELFTITEELNDHKKKQAAYNAEILRRRELEEKQDFYRVLIGQQEIDDIQCLLSIREKLTFRENLDKLIYEMYISKPTSEMVKRILKGCAPSGVYKITRLKTGEIYVGKSVDVGRRWIDHVKAAYGVGTIAHSVLHTTIKKDGIENFTFELLEEVPKDKLTEREKYWITFYDSKNYGLNMREG